MSKVQGLSPISTAIGASFKVKGKLYGVYVQCVRIDGSESWAIRV